MAKQTVTSGCCRLPVLLLIQRGFKGSQHDSSDEFTEKEAARALKETKLYAGGLSGNSQAVTCTKYSVHLRRIVLDVMFSLQCNYGAP